MSNKLPKQSHTRHIVEPDQISIQQFSAVSGPLPSSEEFGAYENKLPGTGNRIVTMAEKEQDHRHQHVDKITEAHIQNAKGTLRNVIRGQWLAISGVVVVSALCGYLAYLGHAEEAGQTARYVIVALAAVFLGNKFISSKSESKS
jgi:uncharacterized membrane protein